jgi:hypothetical protein
MAEFISEYDPSGLLECLAGFPDDAFFLDQGYLFPVMTPEAIAARNAAGVAKMAEVAREEEAREDARVRRMATRTGRRKASRMAHRGY